MTWLLWFKWYLEVLLWSRKHEPPLSGEHDPLLPEEMRIGTIATALDWTAYGAAQSYNKSYPA